MNSRPLSVISTAGSLHASINAAEPGRIARPDGSPHLGSAQSVQKENRPPIVWPLGAAGRTRITALRWHTLAHGTGRDVSWRGRGPGSGPSSRPRPSTTRSIAAASISSRPSTASFAVLTLHRFRQFLSAVLGFRGRSTLSYMAVLIRKARQHEGPPAPMVLTSEDGPMEPADVIS